MKIVDRRLKIGINPSGFDMFVRRIRKNSCCKQSTIIIRHSSTRNGFTLVELMVALVLTCIASVGIYRGYTSFSTSYDVQVQVAEQNQNLRIAIQQMVHDIRKVGYTQAAGAVITAMNQHDITFRVLNDSTGHLDTYTYQRNATDPEKLDKIVNLATLPTPEEPYPDAIIENVDALDFVYLDANRTVTGVNALVRFVQIAIVVKTTNEDYTYTDSLPYYNLQGGTILVPPPDDHFRRRVLTAEVECRNMGF